MTKYSYLGIKDEGGLLERGRVLLEAELDSRYELVQDHDGVLGLKDLTQAGVLATSLDPLKLLTSRELLLEPRLGFLGVLIGVHGGLANRFLNLGYSGGDRGRRGELDNRRELLGRLGLSLEDPLQRCRGRRGRSLLLLRWLTLVLQRQPVGDISTHTRQRTLHSGTGQTTVISLSRTRGAVFASQGDQEGGPHFEVGNNSDNITSAGSTVPYCFWVAQKGWFVVEYMGHMSAVVPVGGPCWRNGEENHEDGSVSSLAGRTLDPECISSAHMYSYFDPGWGAKRGQGTIHSSPLSDAWCSCAPECFEGAPGVAGVHRDAQGRVAVADDTSPATCLGPLMRIQDDDLKNHEFVLATLGVGSVHPSNSTAQHVFLFNTRILIEIICHGATSTNNKALSSSVSANLRTKPDANKFEQKN
uniref:(California timema) hypothetical protein n=1 Tax=Timema californicum TaxID=61474 RepID=A0A7R9PBU1_TIMCA|nr:unnamed protein product [Timema californicum]